MGSNREGLEEDRMSSYKIKAQYKKSSATIEIAKHGDVWCYGFNILFNESDLYHGQSFAPLIKWNSFKTEFECKKEAVKYVLETFHKWDMREVKIARKLYTIASAIATTPRISRFRASRKISRRSASVAAPLIFSRNSFRIFLFILILIPRPEKQICEKPQGMSRLQRRHNYCFPCSRKGNTSTLGAVR